MGARSGPTSALLDREAERAALDGMLGDLRSGRGRALVVRGEAGVGKSALLDYTVGAAADMRLARTAGVESEMELAFASVHQLCTPLLDRADGLPAPQRDALDIAFGLRAGAVPDRFLVGLAVLGLLAATAEDQPLACLIDDAQWLDRATVQCLAFAARRLLAEPIAMIFAAHPPADDHDDEVAIAENSLVPYGGPQRGAVLIDPAPEIEGLKRLHTVCPRSAIRVWYALELPGANQMTIAKLAQNSLRNFARSLGV